LPDAAGCPLRAGCCCYCVRYTGYSQLKYETGDHVGMYARNSEQVVARLAELLGLPQDTSFKLHTEGEGARWALAVCRLSQ
jgi:sulfite reductase alpha subunit-like flavoprotein